MGARGGKGKFEEHLGPRAEALVPSAQGRVLGNIPGKGCAGRAWSPLCASLASRCRAQRRSWLAGAMAAAVATALGGGGEE